MTRLLPRLPVHVLALTLGFAATRAVAAPVVLSNGPFEARLGDRGLLAITDRTIGATYHLQQDEFAIAIGGATYESRALARPVRKADRNRVIYTWTAGPYRVEVVYEVRPGWRFLSKQVLVVGAPSPRVRVEDVSVFRAALAEPIADTFVPKSVRAALGTHDYGGCLRFADNRGLLAVVQNPFLKFQREGNTFALGYRPEMDWSLDDGPFVVDRGLLAPYRLTRRRLPERMRPEWQLGPGAAAPGMDEAEIETFTELVRAFLVYRPERPLNVFVGWCANDYQIDVATPEGRAEYKRLIDRAAELGAEYVLYAPSNSTLSRRGESVDDWSWEHVLWLGLGQRIRKGEWEPRSGTVPASVQEMLDYAKAERVKLLAYVYPVLPFSQNPAWLVPGRTPDRKNASLGVRSLQDWLIDALTAFHQKTGIGGYAFDHTFLTYPGTSRYAQWWGWRRVMEELRRRMPDIAIDGRQAYHLYGPWSWLAGSYPHPTFNDEQPESFVPFPDLHFDRVSADRERFTAYRYRNYEFAPSEIVPGFITHQTSRSDETDDMPSVKTDQGVLLSRFRARDWDSLGWRYSLLSSIAIAGWNNLINMIPARDLEEFRHFADADKRWFRQWIDWTDRNREFLRRTRTILGQPALGTIDGTSAILDNRGYIFLFNPNGRQMNAEFVLDETIGLSRDPGSVATRSAASRRPGPASTDGGPGGRFMLTELYPVEGRRVGKPGAGVWSFGDHVSIEMDGGSAMVLELQPAPHTIERPMLFNAPGSATSAEGVIEVTGARGEPGTTVELLVLLPDHGGTSGAARADLARPGAGMDRPSGPPDVKAVRVNGRELPFSRTGANVIRVQVRFDGARFRQYQQIGEVDPGFTGGTYSASFTVPQRIHDQLAARARAWPIPWDAHDYQTTWLAPHRLLLFVQIAEPDDRWEARLAIDGRPVELRKAYSAIRAVRRTFVGFYADVSLLSADREHRLEIELPALRPGQFQGVFFENVEPEYTGAIAR